MTNETRSRIRAYTEELPHMKEKVFGALLMLVIATMVTVTSTYAWVTLSRSPEVSDIKTTLAANGVLEIALSKPDGTEPDEFDIDESILDRDVSVTTSNLQWGNLVNLYDDSYGIDNLALRPAQLNDADLLNNPLWGATYGEDGRITDLNYFYTYTKFDGNQFVASKDYGVRAISSYTEATSDSTTQTRTAKINTVGTAQGNVNSAYNTDVSDAFSALGKLISRIAQDRVNKSNFAVDPTETNSVLNEYLPDISDFYKALKNAMELQKEAYVALANLQLYQYAMGGEDRGEFAETKWATLETNHVDYNVDPDKPDEGSDNGIIALTGLSQFIKDYVQLSTDLNWLEAYITDYRTNGTEYRWGENNGTLGGPQIATMIERLINYSELYLIINGEKVGLGSIQGYAMDLYGAQGKDNPYPVYVTGGILQNFEQIALDSGRLDGAPCNITFSATVTIGFITATDSVEIYGQAYTTAAGSSYFAQDFTAARNLDVNGSEKIAEDTYGLVVDLWVRTNAETTCLTLEGATSTDQQGNIYSYDGVNRIWGATGGSNLTTDSTTQGGGSCYIYYADTPDDAARSLKLLNAMKVAFVSESGKLLATAEMDTANAWEVNGRITVPMVLENNLNTLTYTYVDSSHKEQTGRAITTLYTDVPVRVTAIVYLDGEDLKNEDVLAAAEIQGSLNIQFGSSTNLTTKGDNELYDDVRYVTATASPLEMNYDDKLTDSDLDTQVTLTVVGTQPSEITAFFVREINSTQGTRETPAMEFQRQDDNTWTCTHRFTAPGTYWLRHVRLDGVDYALSEPLEITVTGFELKEANWTPTTSELTVRTSAGSYSVGVSATFATDDPNKMPSSVKINFVSDLSNTVSVPLTYKGGSLWEGTATFNRSGVYTMEYMVYTISGESNGRYKDLDTFKKTLDLSLGMYVSTKNIDSTMWDKYEEGVSYTKNISVLVYNNAGAVLDDLDGLTLYYCNAGDLTNTRSANLTWDPVEKYYAGTLNLDKPGRWQFGYVKMADGNRLSKCTVGDVYTIISPDPPVYDTSSACTKNNEDGYQLVPLSNDAVISGLTISNASAADVSVVVYSEAKKQYYVVDDVSLSDDVWTVKLPTYTLDLNEDGTEAEDAVYEQEGEWSVVAVMLSNCYDEKGNIRSNATVDSEGNECEPNPIVWVGNDAISQSWLAGSGLNADASYDFSALSTNVSQSVKVTMYPVNTALGGDDYEFMHKFWIGDGEVSELLSYVRITDANGTDIPRDKVNAVTLKMQYSGNTNESYGYKVTGYSMPYEFKMEWPENDESGHYTIRDQDQVCWQYVGEYKVTGLTVTINNGTTDGVLVPDSAITGVPEKYTVTTAGPDADDISMTVEEKLILPLGMTGNNVTGTFLETYNLDGIRATFNFKNAESAKYVDLSDFVSNVELVLEYQGGSEDNGGYTWSGTSKYELINSEDIAMTATGSTYNAGSTPLLAGTYTGYITATIGDATVTQDLNYDIEVHSKAPTLTVTGVSPETSFNVDTYSGETKYYSNAELVSVQNYFASDGTWANVYIEATSDEQEYNSDGDTVTLIRYTLPTVTLELGNAGSNFVTATATIPNAADSAYDVTYEFSQNALKQTKAIGGKEEKAGSAAESGTCGGDEITVNWDVQYNAGSQTISRVTMTDSNSCTYSVALETSVTIREENEAPPSISYKAMDGYNTFETEVSKTGESFQVTLPTTAQFGMTYSKDVPVITGAADDTWTADDLVSSTSNGMFYVTGEQKENQVTTGNGCTGTTTTTYVYYEFTYYLYQRVQRVYEKTETTSYYDMTYGLTGWKIDDVIYQPGETITVSGVVTAVPVVGMLEQVFVSEEVATVVHTTQQDVENGTSTHTGDKESDTDAADAKARYTEGIPSGYSAFNADDAFDKGDLNTEETQYGQDYTKTSTS